ncbi:hypothetical protein CA13_61830 [Planctomycetes bacterium CA13]|uniref:Uncharacterized protein n=1 Tax=Novipirellula herctigrandis TaxID=2527986 RepID=A0A5C5ZDU2_9BACT|nr:hypothetical protein CA13_61830 [Planctomycetes bacterium CA13]
MGSVGEELRRQRGNTLGEASPGETFNGVRYKFIASPFAVWDPRSEGATHRPKRPEARPVFPE